VGALALYSTNQNQEVARAGFCYTNNDTDSLSSEAIEPMLTVEQVAKWLQVSPQWVYRNWGKLGGVKLVGKLRFDKRIVERRSRELN
jgi:hypothetical protein